MQRGGAGAAVAERKRHTWRAARCGHRTPAFPKGEIAALGNCRARLLPPLQRVEKLDTLRALAALVSYGSAQCRGFFVIFCKKTLRGVRFCRTVPFGWVEALPKQ